MHENRGRALLRNQLERRRQRHPHFLGWQQLEELLVVLEIRTCAVAPRIPLASTARNPEVATHAAVHPLGHRLRRFDCEPVRVERFAVFARRLKRLEASCCVVADRHDLERDDVHIAARRAAEVIRDAEALASVLSGEVEARLFDERGILRVLLRLVHNEIVADALGREVAVHRFGAHPATIPCFDLESLERRLELLANDLVELRARTASAPLQTEQLVLVEQREHFVERNVAEHLRAPERRRWNRVVVRHVAALAAGRSTAHVLAHVAVQEGVVARVGDQFVRNPATTIVPTLQGVHRLQPFERVLAVEHARLVGTLWLDEQRTTPEATIDRRASDEHRDVNPALVELLHA